MHFRLSRNKKIIKFEKIYLDAYLEALFPRNSNYELLEGDFSLAVFAKTILALSELILITVLHLNFYVVFSALII